MRYAFPLTLIACTAPVLSEDPAPRPSNETGSPEPSAPADWIPLDGECTPPEIQHADPIAQIGGVFLQDLVFAEVVDVTLDSQTQVAFAVGHSGLFSIDVSDPTELAVLDHLEPTQFGSRFYQVELGSDDRIFATNRDGGLSMIDRSNPEALVELDRVQMLGMGGMAVQDDLLLVTDRYGGLWSYEIEVESVSERDHLEEIGHAWDVVIAHDLAYVGTNDQGLIPVDISDPDQLEVLPTISTSGGVQDLTLSPDGQTLYAAVGGAGFEIFSLDDPTTPVSLGTLNTGDSALSISIGDQLLWVATMQDVVAFDLADPRDPVRINTQQTDQWAMGVAADGDRAYVADWGWFSAFQRVQLDPAPDLDPSSTQLYLNEEGDRVQLQLHNLGDHELSLGTASSSDSRIQISAASTSIAPSEQVAMQIEYSGGGDLNATLCLASSDPDEPQIQFTLQDGPADDQLGLGSIAPDFDLVDLDGEVYRLSDQRGRPVLLVYFATW